MASQSIELKGINCLNYRNFKTMWLLLDYTIDTWHNVLSIRSKRHHHFKNIIAR